MVAITRNTWDVLQWDSELKDIGWNEARECVSMRCRSSRDVPPPPLDCLIVVTVVFRVAANQKVFVSYGSWTDSPCDLGGRPYQ